MAHVAFDTLKFVERLKSAGVSDIQAKAMTEAQNEAFVEALDTIVATKTDISDLKHQIESVKSELKGDINLLRWMMGFLLAGVLSLVIKAFF